MVRVEPQCVVDRMVGIRRFVLPLSSGDWCMDDGGESQCRKSGSKTKLTFCAPVAVQLAVTEMMQPGFPIQSSHLKVASQFGFFFSLTQR